MYARWQMSTACRRATIQWSLSPVESDGVRALALMTHSVNRRVRHQLTVQEGVPCRSGIPARLGLAHDRVVFEEQLLTERGGCAFRDVRQGSDQALYVLTDEDNGQLLRIVPRPYVPPEFLSP